MGIEVVIMSILSKQADDGEMSEHIKLDLFHQVQFIISIIHLKVIFMPL